jgi:DNA-3-methyladenine glycosylase
MPPIERAFYQRPTEEVARGLLGAVLVRALPEGLVAVRLTEVEAYLGVDDPACHTFRGRRTERTRTMWGPAGHLYVYFTYGMHYCANVVTRDEGVPEAVLLRAATPVLGEEIILVRRKGRGGRDLVRGPARLCQGLGLDRSADGADLTRGDGVWLASDGLVVPPAEVDALPRVGVTYAGAAASWPLRFVVRSEPARRRRLAARRAVGDAGAC